MAKVKVRESKKQRDNPPAKLPFTSENYIIFSIGILLLFIGYFALGTGPANSLESLSIGPVILVLSYCVVIPLAILYRKNTEKDPKKGD